ncbi:hypothetical protein PG993_002563 [Apiospora rasikravindrae]|uniref:Uncharacterized protein n=1 Tax=Apiospora rasikravindrae TaxID=990691 RepID=A0ABR1TX18_9PEZI
MHISSAVSLVLLAAMPSFVLAAPQAAQDPLARQGYEGPCADTNCGAEGKDCTKTSQKWCTPFPSTKRPWQGCTCSSL